MRFFATSTLRTRTIEPLTGGTNSSSKMLTEAVSGLAAGTGTCGLRLYVARRSLPLSERRSNMRGLRSVGLKDDSGGTAVA
ncbi:hypothetical protein GCM10012276_32460 [Nocardioides deserti]|nr:hypothetical protein GCM10012276_32460 [Nocardioides deserti]